MIVTYNEIISEVIRLLGLDEATIDPAVLTSIKLRINESQDVIFFDSDWEWRKRTFFDTTKTPYETGTITVTQNSRTITGSGTTWLDSFKLGYVFINGKTYKIDSIVSTTSLKLVAPYDEETLAGQEYKIIFPDMMLNHELSAIVDVKYQGNSLDIKHKNRLIGKLATLQLPREAALSDRTSEDYYNTGTVTVTQGSTSITGVGTSWLSDMEGMTFRVNEFSKEYTIRSVNSTTSITLKESYDGADGSGKSYKINPTGLQIMTLRGSPDDYYTLEIEGLIKAPKLVNNNDISLIPNHMPLIHCAVWLAGSDLENKNPVRIQQARADFERTLKQLRSSYKILTNVQWRNENEQRIRTGFDPLSRR